MGYLKMGLKPHQNKTWMDQTTLRDFVYVPFPRHAYHIPASVCFLNPAASDISKAIALS